MRTAIRSRRHRPHAMVILEVVIALAVIGVLLTIFTLAAGDSRRAASLSGSLSNLKQFAWAGSSYTGDNAERFWTFSWRAGTTPSSYPDLQTATDDVEAAANQAVDIIRRRADPTMPRVFAWIPNLLYSHLVLADHLNFKLPAPWAVSPEDPFRLAWQQWPTNPLPLPSGGAEQRRWIYSSTYETGPAFINADMRVGAQMVISQGSTHNTYQLPGGVALGNRLITQVAFPSSKAMLWDPHQRHFGPRLAYFGSLEARVPVLTVDGSATVRASSESNQGFQPNNPTNSLPSQYTYSPLNFEPPLPPGAGSIMTGRFRWTRGGLTGRDFGAPEVCTGQPGCTP